MKPSGVLIGIGLLLPLLILALSAVALQASNQSPVPNPQSTNSQSTNLPTYQLLTNPGLEFYDPPYAQFEGVDCQVATGWQRFWYGSPEPYWMDARVFASSHLGTGWVERIEGETSQLIIATEPYTAGIRQQVSGLRPGVGYGFHAAMLTIFQTSAQDPVHGTMIKQVGMDPTGGTDPQASTVVWSEPFDRDQTWDLQRRTAVYAQVPTMTVFIRVISPYESGGLPYLNYSILDSAILAQTAVVTATSPAVSEVLTFTVRWNNAVPSPGAEIRWYDLQWMDEEEGVWHGWLTWTQELAAPFVGERGHAYRFRARAWQRYPNNAHLYGPYRPEGDTRTLVKGPSLIGRVLNNKDLPVTGATVSISGTTDAATTGAGGHFVLDVLPSADPQTITASHPWWSAPAPVYGVTFGPTETVVLTWTLRPPDDAVVNGGFESGLDGWSLIASQGVTPTVVTEPVHTGHGALALGGAWPVSLTVGVTQTLAVTDVWEPVLSFWYRPVTTDSDDVFNVVLTVMTRAVTLPVTLTVRVAAPMTGTITPTWTVTTTRVFTPALDAAGWRHLWYSLVPPETALTGRVTVRFQVWDDGDGATTLVYLDEVSLGSTPGGPYKIYLPLALK